MNQDHSFCDAGVDADAQADKSGEDSQFVIQVAENGEEENGLGDKETVQESVKAMKGRMAKMIVLPQDPQASD